MTELNRWDERYKTKDTPWDTGHPHSQVARLFHEYANTGGKGPPALSALEVIEVVEPYFEIIEMQRCDFFIDRGTQGQGNFNAWACVFKKRN